MNYEFSNEILSSRCFVLNSNSTATNYVNARTRQNWVRSGSKWYKQSQTTTTYDQDLSSYTCQDPRNIEYEYSYNEPIYQIISMLVVCTAFVLAFWLVIYRLFKGGMKW